MKTLLPISHCDAFCRKKPYFWTPAVGRFSHPNVYKGNTGTESLKAKKKTKNPFCSILTVLMYAGFIIAALVCYVFIFFK